jgi:hypothetical protein
MYKVGLPDDLAFLLQERLFFVLDRKGPKLNTLNNFSCRLPEPPIPNLLEICSVTSWAKRQG